MARTSIDARLKVTIEPRVDGIPRSRLARCMELFQDFCVVTESVRGGIDVAVEVEPKGVVEEAEEQEPVRG